MAIRPARASPAPERTQHADRGIVLAAGHPTGIVAASLEGGCPQPPRVTGLFTLVAALRDAP